MPEKMYGKRFPYTGLLAAWILSQQYGKQSESDAMHATRSIILLLLVVVIISPLRVVAEDDEEEKTKRYLFQWTDEKGIEHITDSLGVVPERFRSTVRRMESPQGSDPGPADGASQGYVPSSLDAGNEAQKAYWQQRMRDAKMRLMQAENRYRSLEKERSDLLATWGAGVYAPPQDVLDKLAAIDREMAAAQKEIADARNFVEEQLPDEARRAGVPPGWLRE